MHYIVIMTSAYYNKQCDSWEDFFIDDKIWQLFPTFIKFSNKWYNLIGHPPCDSPQKAMWCNDKLLFKIKQIKLVLV